MSQITIEEMDRDRVSFVDRIMADLGFTRHDDHKSSRKRSKWTDMIRYQDENSGDFISVTFPDEDQWDKELEIATQVVFNKVKSPVWRSLYEVEENIPSWIDECRNSGT